MQFKKATVIPKNKNDNYCFAYAITIAIYHNEIGKNLNRISNKLLDCADKLNWNPIDFSASTPDYKRFEKLNEDIALNVISLNKEDNDNGIETIDVEQEYISSFNFTRKKTSSIIKDFEW